MRCMCKNQKNQINIIFAFSRIHKESAQILLDPWKSVNCDWRVKAKKTFTRLQNQNCTTRFTVMILRRCCPYCRIIIPHIFIGQFLFGVERCVVCDHSILCLFSWFYVLVWLVRCVINKLLSHYIWVSVHCTHIGCMVLFLPLNFNVWRFGFQCVCE